MMFTAPAWKLAKFIGPCAMALSAALLVSGSPALASPFCAGLDKVLAAARDVDRIRGPSVRGHEWDVTIKLEGFETCRIGLYNAKLQYSCRQPTVATLDEARTTLIQLTKSIDGCKTNWRKNVQKQDDGLIAVYLDPVLRAGAILILASRNRYERSRGKLVPKKVWLVELSIRALETQ